MNNSVLMSKSALELQSSLSEKQTKESIKGTFTFGKEQRLSHKTQYENLGPGSYNIEKKEDKRMRATSFAKSQRSTIISEIPPSSSVGPGKYEIDAFSKILPKSSSVAVMKSKRFAEVREFSPGPGQYEINSIYVKNKESKGSFSRQARDFYELKEKLPGPGNYNITTSIGSGSKVNINIDRLDFDKRQTQR